MRKRLISILLTMMFMISLIGTAVAETDPCSAFTDVNRASWYHTALDFVVKNQLMSGTSKTTFAPGSTVSRAMTVQTFYAIAGKPAFNGATAFRDVQKGSWYFESVNWASANHLAAGTGGGAFRPNDNVTREQLAVFFKAFAGYRGKNATSRKALSGYVDQSSVSGYAKDAMSWAVAVGLISGKGSGRLAPKDTATRAELAQMLYRFMSISGSPASSETAKPSESPKPSETVNPTPAPSQTVKPSDEPKPTESLKPSETPAPTESPKPTAPTIPLEDVQITPSHVTMKVGETIRPTVTYIPANHTEKIEAFWMTSDVKTVTGLGDGVFQALKTGTAIIGLNVNNRFAPSCEITVVDDSSDFVRFEKTHYYVDENSTQEMEYEASSVHVQWTSSDPSIATVKNGVVSTKEKGGKVTITAAVGDVSATCEVYVNGFVDAGKGYSLLNDFRTEKGVSYWYEGNHEKRVFNTNERNTLSPLLYDEKLEQTAKIRARELAENYDHTRPDGSSCFTAYPNYSALGENIARGQDSIDEVTEDWKESNCVYEGQGHRRNMLDPGFNRVGIAGYTYKGRIYWVQSFGYKP